MSKQSQTNPASARPTPAADVLRRDPDRGRLVTGGAAAVALLSEDFVRQLHVAIIETYGENAQDVLYRSGYEWGLQAMIPLQAAAASAAGAPELWDRPPEEVLAMWWQPLAEQGWGAASFEATGAKGVAVVELQHSAVAPVLGPAEDPVCHLYAGLFAGALSFIQQAERHGTEITCRAGGGELCRFVIASAAQVDAAEAWRQQGSTAGEIVQRLR